MSVEDSRWILLSSVLVGLYTLSSGLKTTMTCQQKEVDGKVAVPRREMTHHVRSDSRRTSTTEEGSISPPPSKRRRIELQASDMDKKAGLNPKLVPSPFSLNEILGLPEDGNVDTLSLRDLIGDPLIRECWFFDYLYDVDWLM